MNSILPNLFECRKKITVNAALALFAMSFIFLANHYDIKSSTFAQMAEDPLNLMNNNSGGILNQPPASVVSNDSLADQQQLSGFTANGKVNTVISVPAGKWLASGDWHITMDNGNVTNFDTNMTWYNSSGTNAHTHEITNFRASSDNQPLSVKKVGKDIIIEGITDVGSNNKISWFEVPTTFTMKDERILSIEVDDAKTNRHFGGQPILGIADFFKECSDSPGANMEILLPCTEPTIEQEGLDLSNETTEFTGFGNETTEFTGFGNETTEFTGFGNETTEFTGFGDQTSDGTTGGSEEFSGFGDETGGRTTGGDQTSDGTTGGSEENKGSKQFSGFGDETGGRTTGGDQTSDGTTGGSEENKGINRENKEGGMFSGFGDETAGSTDEGEMFSGFTGEDQMFSGFGDETAVRIGEKKDFGSEFNTECAELIAANITASGFESDPADSHPPFDAIDGNSSTWWSDDGKDPWVELDVGQPVTLCGFSVEWNKGDERDYSFTVEVSENGSDFKEVLSDNNKEGSSDEEIYPFEESDGQYMRLIVTDTSSGDGWASIKEINAIGIPPAGGELFPAFGNESSGEFGGEELFPAFGNESSGEFGGEELFPAFGN